MKLCNFVCQLAMRRALAEKNHAQEELAQNCYRGIYIWSEAGCSYFFGEFQTQP